jgi:peptidoglycan/LPS O-acetylase OafA/YrhL
MKAHTINNFGLIRFLMAFVVFAAHFLGLAQVHDLPWLSTWIDSACALAVQLFFLISGYFSISSFERSVSVFDFYKKRFFRIYPAYAFVVFLSFLGFSLISSFGLKEYFFSLESWKYLGGNLVFANFLAPTLPGVFEHNFLPVVNGSLWTLKIEVAFFLFVPCIVFLRNRLGNWPVSLGLIILSFGYNFLIEKVFMLNIILVKQLPGQLYWFLFGVIAFDLRYRIRTLNIWTYFILAIPFLMIQNWWPEAYIVASIIWLLGIALKLPLVKFSDELGNLSYSFYLIHFPLTQLMIYWGLAGNDHGISLASALLILMMISFLIFRFVEEPQIRNRKS